MPPADESHIQPTAISTAAEPSTRPVVGMLLILLQLVLLAAIVRQFGIESHRHFFPVLCLLIGGSAVHVWLPGAWRMRFFTGLSMACVLFVLGARNGLCVLGIGAGLIAICRLPLLFRTRTALLVAAGIVLILSRNRFPAAFWPVLGSMFMFRLALYMYEIRKRNQPEPLAATAAYFCMAPNVCFPLFPVVDYKLFRDSRIEANDLDVQQRGVTWMIRGVAHLLLYRYVNQYLVPQPYELYDLPHVVQFMATNFALYLQVSGQFHLITGSLHLFGFDLPRTHQQYFLASSFNDIWRRINIYWKDFMAKCFFYPALYAMRSRGASLNTALVTGVFVVFTATWLLHSWQTFWLLGRFPLTVNDASLWLGAGVCVAVNSWLETRRASRPSRPAWWSAAGEAVRTIAMFGLVSLFWAFWTRPGFLNVLRGVLRRPDAAQGALTVAGWALAAACGVALWNGAGRWWASGASSRRTRTFRETAQLSLVAMALFFAGLSPSVSKLLGTRFEQAVADFRSGRADDAAAGRLLGYYEDLNAAVIQAGPLMQSLTPQDERRREQALGFEKVSQEVGLPQEVELRPGVSIELEGRQFTVNEYGMRDRSGLSLHKPAHTLRIALLGSSIVMGYGVSDEEVFGRLLENRLNAERDAGAPRIEVLNFGVGKQWATHRLLRLQRIVFGFEPDVLIYVAHQDEFLMIDKHPAKLLGNGLELPSPHMAEVARSAGVEPDAAWGEIESRLQRRRPEMLGAVYRTIVEECRSRDVVPVYVYVPVPGSLEDPGQELRALAREAGFEVGDLSDWFAGVQTDGLFPPGDAEHPNARGHQLIAEALLRLINERPEMLPD